MAPQMARAGVTALVVAVLLQVASAQFQMKCTNYGGPFDGVGAGQGSFGLTEGGCGYGNINDPSVWPYRRAIAFDPAGSAVAGKPSFGCGTCWKVTNKANWKSVVVVVTDICPGCGSKFGGPAGNHIDMHFDTWKEIAAPGQMSANGGGILDVVAEEVACTQSGAGGGDATVTIMDFKGTWSWLRVRPSVSTTEVSIQCASVTTTGGNPESNGQKYWSRLANSWGTVFETAQVPLYTPGSYCQIYVKTSAGEVLGTGAIKMDDFKGFGMSTAVPLSAAAARGRKLSEIPFGTDATIADAVTVAIDAAETDAAATRKMLA